ncbi:MAG: YciI-like protein [Bacteroidota bacterium]
MYFVLFYETTEGFLDKRKAYRASHLTHAQQAAERGHLLLAGALEDPADKAVLLFQVEDKSQVETFAQNDPYVQQGLITKWEIRPWRVMLGSLKQA